MLLTLILNFKVYLREFIKIKVTRQTQDKIKDFESFLYLTELEL